MVKRIPERLDKKQARMFLVEVAPLLRADRPQIVFDLSQVRHVDAAGIDMLLGCVTEVMKHDGDIKLASVSPQAAVVLEFTRTGRLFETYDTTSEAVSSFSGFLPNVVKQLYGTADGAAKMSPQPVRERRKSERDKGAGKMAA